MPSVRASRCAGGERLVVRRADVLRAAGVAQVRVLGPDARVVEAGGDRVRVENLAVVVGEHRRARAVQHRRATRAERRRARRLDADQPHVVVDEAREDPDRVRAAADARDDRVGQPSLGASTCSRASRPITDCSSRDQLRVRVRADARADQVVRRLDVRDPVADRLARRLLQRLRPELDRAHLRAEQVHALDVRALAAHVLGAHVDDAVEAEARADGRGCDAVLARAGLRDDALLAEPPGEHRLAERVVQLVRAGVEQVLALEVEALAGREAVGERERRRAARVRREQVVQLRVEGVVGERGAPAGLELVERGDQRLGHVAPAVVAVVQHRAASTNARTFASSLIPGSLSSEELASTAHGRTASIASPHVLRREAAGEHHADRRATTRGPVAWILALPRQVDDRATALAVAEQGGVARRGARSRARRAGRGRRASRRRPRRRPRPRERCPGTSSTRGGAPRRLAGEDEADEVGAGVDRDRRRPRRGSARRPSRAGGRSARRASRRGRAPA